jgi:hypothetical protein
MLFDEAFPAETSVSAEFDSTVFFTDGDLLVMIHYKDDKIVSRTRLNREGRLRFIWLMLKFHFRARGKKETGWL